MYIRFHDTHAYPGCAATIIDAHAADGLTIATVEFSDGVHSTARVVTEEDGRLHVSIAPYRTARGTAVAAKDWELARRSDGNWKVTTKGRRA